MEVIMSFFPELNIKVKITYYKDKKLSYFLGFTDPLQA